MSELKDQVKSLIINGKKMDLVNVYANRELMDKVIDFLIEPYIGKVDYVASPEALGFAVGSMAAMKLGVGFIPIRDRERYPLENGEAISVPFIDHKNVARAMQVRKGVIKPGMNILLVDNWVQTAATMQACTGIIDEIGAHLVGIASIGAEYNDVTKGMIDTGKLRSVVVE